jgi:hypothetical protein
MLYVLIISMSDCSFCVVLMDLIEETRACLFTLTWKENGPRHNCPRHKRPG